MTGCVVVNQPYVRVRSVVLNNFVNDSRVLKSCRSLVAAGYGVSVVALHDGSELRSEETVDGIIVHRVRLTTKNWPRLKAVQLLKYAEFVFRVQRDFSDAEVFHCNDLNALFVGAVCKRTSGGRLRIVYDAHEHESERNGFSPLMRTITRWLERKLLRYADRVITVSPSIADDYMRLYGIHRPDVIYNAPYFSERLSSQILRNRLGISPQQKIFLYQGSLVQGRGLEMALRVFAKLGQDVCLVVLGGGPLASLVQRFSERYPNIFHLGMVDPRVLASYTCSADYGIALIENTCRSYFLCLPNKLFEFMMAEVPVVVSNMLELERFVSRHAVGVVTKVTEGDLECAIRTILNADYTNYVRNIRSVKPLFTWEQQERALIELYDGIVGITRSARPGTSPVRGG